MAVLNRRGTVEQYYSLRRLRRRLLAPWGLVALAGRVARALLTKARELRVVRLPSVLPVPHGIALLLAVGAARVANPHRVSPVVGPMARRQRARLVRVVGKVEPEALRVQGLPMLAATVVLGSLRQRLAVLVARLVPMLVVMELSSRLELAAEEEVAEVEPGRQGPMLVTAVMVLFEEVVEEGEVVGQVGQFLVMVGVAAMVRLAKYVFGHGNARCRQNVGIGADNALTQIGLMDVVLWHPDELSPQNVHK